MAPLTWCSYASAQSKFIFFCHQLGKLHPSGSLRPTDEWTLCLFVAFLTRSLQYSSIKVYLSGIRALNIDQGFLDPLTDCLCLQRVVYGIQRCQDTPSSTQLPITDDLMLVIWWSLDLSLPDHQMFWAACSLGYFSFLCASEFTVFATTPKVIPMSHIVANIESGIYHLSKSSKAAIRASVVNILSKSKPEATPNITRQQFSSVRELQQDPSVTIVPADKGKLLLLWT